AFTPPTHCPFCNAELTREEGKVVLLCPNRIGCPAQRLGAIEFFASRHQMNIDGLGEKVVAQLVEAQLISDLADLFDLTPEKLDRFAEQSAKNLVAAIATAKQAATFSRLLAALGITNVGSTLAKPIAAKYGKLSALRAASAEKSSDQLVAELHEIEGVGEVI